MSRRKKQKLLSLKNSSLNKKTSSKESEELLKRTEVLLSNKQTNIKKEAESTVTETIEPDEETAAEH